MSSAHRGDRRLLSLKGVQINVRQKMDGIALLEALPDRIASLAFLDPQYRDVLDKLAYGNEGAKQKGRAALPQMTSDTIAFFLEEIARVLRPSGHAFLWVDKFTIAEGLWRRWIRRTAFEVVDLIAWNKMRPGNGYRTRGVTEYCVVLQKPPKVAKGVWTDHSIRDSWSEFADRERHAHCKPYLLTERLIRSVTDRDDLVLDPCAGGYGVLEACRQTGRHFIGCDLNG